MVRASWLAQIACVIIISMKLSIFHKLTLALLGLTAIILVATLGLARWSFERGFLEYVNAIERTRLNDIILELEHHYVAAGNSWRGLDDEKFSAALVPESSRRPPRGGPRMSPVEAPPRIVGGPPPRPEKRKRSGPPTTLLDIDGNRIVGAALPKNSELLTRVDVIYGGAKVGELVTLPRRRLDSPQETQFAKQQERTSIVIGVLALGLATLLSLLIARALLNPLRKTINAVNILSNGDYSIRTDEKRSDELGELMRNFDRLASVLEKNLSARKRTLADISHELRTPLTTLSGELEALKDGIRPFDKKQVLSLDQEVQRLKNLVEDLYQLSLSDIGGLRYEFEQVNLDELLHQVTSRYRDRGNQLGIKLRYKGKVESMINGDMQRLDQLISNLLENSLAYTDSPGEIFMELSKEGKKIIIQLIDTPPGVSEYECELLFEPLYRQDGSRNRRTAGAGLGLAICRNIVDAHHGDITARPSERGGLHIIINFPEYGEV